MENNKTNKPTRKSREKKDQVQNIAYRIKKDPKKKEVDFEIASETITNFDLLVAYSMVIQDCMSQAEQPGTDKAIVEYFQSLSHDLSRQLASIKEDLEGEIWPKKKNDTIALIDIYNRIKGNLESRYEGLIIEPVENGIDIIPRIAMLIDLESSLLKDEFLISPKERNKGNSSGGTYELGGDEDGA